MYTDQPSDIDQPSDNLSIQFQKGSVYWCTVPVAFGFPTPIASWFYLSLLRASVHAQSMVRIYTERQPPCLCSILSTSAPHSIFSASNSHSETLTLLLRYQHALSLTRRALILDFGRFMPFVSYVLFWTPNFGVNPCSVVINGSPLLCMPRPLSVGPRVDHEASPRFFCEHPTGWSRFCLAAGALVSDHIRRMHHIRRPRAGEAWPRKRLSLKTPLLVTTL
jgi:hypothetical protein